MQLLPVSVLLLVLALAVPAPAASPAPKPEVRAVTLSPEQLATLRRAAADANAKIAKLPPEKRPTTFAGEQEFLQALTADAIRAHADQQRADDGRVFCEGWRGLDRETKDRICTAVPKGAAGCELCP